MTSDVNQRLRGERTFQDFLDLIKNDATVPEHIDELLLRRFFKVTNDDPIKAMELYKHNLRMRKSAPQIFSNRDVLSDELQRISKLLQFVPIPKMTSDHRKILIIRYTTGNSSGYNTVDALKMVLAMTDVRYILPDSEGNLSKDDVLIIDQKLFSFHHFLEIARHCKTVFQYFKYVQEAVPVPTLSCHILNTSWIVNKFMSLIRPVLKKEVADSIRFYRNGYEELCKNVPKEVLPSDYGGDLKTMDELHANWMKIFESKREYLLNEENWTIKENIHENHTQ